MKKNLFESKFNVFRVPIPLTKAQMKGYRGGYIGGGYGGYNIDFGSCGWGKKITLANGETFWSKKCWISKETAKDYQEVFGGWWCCDHCSTTEYCGNIF